MSFPPESGTVSGGYYLANLVGIAEYLMSNGFSRAAAAGIAGTIAGESAGNPASHGSGGAGLMGWTPPSSAKPTALSDTPAVSTWNDQLTDMLYYLHNEGGNLATLQAESNPTTAADLFSQQWERPAVTDSDVKADAITQVYNALAGFSPNSAWTNLNFGSGSGSGSGGLDSFIGVTGFSADLDAAIKGFLWFTQPAAWLRIVVGIAGLGLAALGIYALMETAKA
jgi:hypothetical protein